MAKIDEIITEARKAEENEQWGDGMRYYTEAIRLLDDKCRVKESVERGAKIVEEEDKHKALDWWIGYLRCKIEMIRADSESLLYDVGEEIGRQIREVEREIMKYGIRNKVYLWDRLLRAYDQWGDERRNQGKKREADELQHHMLKARMKRDFWRIFR